MLTVEYSQVFDPNDFWADRTGPWFLLGPDLAGLFEYRYQSAAGYHSVTGAGLTISVLGIPLLGTYTSITVFADAAHTQTIASLTSDTPHSFPCYFYETAENAFAGSDVVRSATAGMTLNGFAGNDTLYGEFGPQTLVGGEGDDT